LDNSYEWYPEKEPAVKKETDKFEATIDLPLGEEYKLKSQIEYYDLTNYRDTHALSSLNEDINNLAV
jgi:hypothetical protein